ncbi:hypothetical protein ACFE04_011994 [Oxalis oulophora]
MENTNSHSVEERLLLDSTEIGNKNVTSDLKKRIWEESKITWRIAFPGVISFGTIVITQLFLGHIGQVDLAAYALVQTLFYRFINGILIGMSSATETLCGQAFGAGHHHMMGIYLQRSWVVNFVTTTLFVPIYLHIRSSDPKSSLPRPYHSRISPPTLVMCPNTWKGFSAAAFQDLWPVIKLSVSSGIMLCLELWYNSILVILAGYMKIATVAIDAFSICVRVSNELGKGNGEAAKFAVKVILCTNTMIGIIFCALCLAFGREISYMFTRVAVGAGFQSTVAYVNLGCYYGIGIPVGALLAYVAGLEVVGLWIAMLIGVVVQTLALVCIVWRLDWDDLAEKCCYPLVDQMKKTSERLDRWLVL